MRLHLIKIKRNTNTNFTFIINNKEINIYFRYNSYEKNWDVNIFEKTNPLVCGLKLTMGYDNYYEYNILEQYQHLDIGQLYFYNLNGETPDYKNLNEVILSWVY